MVPAAKDSDIKWIEHQIKSLANNNAGLSGELSAFKKDVQTVSDRVLVIETERKSEKDGLKTLCDHLDKDLEDNKEDVSKDLSVLKEDYEEKLEALSDDLDAFKAKFATKRVLKIVSISIGIILTIIKIATHFGVTFSMSGG